MIKMMQFKNVVVNQLFTYDREKFKKTGESSAWSFSNGVLIKEWGFDQDEIVSECTHVEVFEMKTYEEIQALAERIVPIVNGQFILPCDPIGIAYTWSNDFTGAVDYKKYETLCEVVTYHSYGYYGLFKPSIAEVLSQIPAQHLENAVAFEIIQQPETVEDLNINIDILNLGYHAAATRIYGNK